ncbi:MAG: type II secretion system protein [bacterium]
MDAGALSHWHIPFKWSRGLTMSLPEKNLRGFTLIELLAVIAIIAVLSALLFPVGMRMRNKALETRCVGNLRQIATASACYSAEHDGKTVYSWYGDELLPWPMVVAPYLGGIPKNKVWVCPAQPHSTAQDNWPGNWGGFTTSVDYGQNLIRADQNKGGFPIRLVTAQAPLSKILYLIEGRNVFWNQGSWDSTVAPYIGAHGPGINALFFDYHVERLTNPTFIQVAAGAF